MDRKAYSKVYNEYKQLAREAMQDGIKRFAEQNPERFAELQAQARIEAVLPQKPRIITRYPSRPLFDVDKFVRSHHTQSFFIHTKDCFGDTHLYFEELNSETAESVLKKRHPKFTERHEEVIKVGKCTCPLCLSPN